MLFRKNDRFSLRKYKVGVCSVFLGSILLGSQLVALPHVYAATGTSLGTDNYATDDEARAANLTAPANANPVHDIRVRNQTYMEGDGANLTPTNNRWDTDNLPGWTIEPGTSGSNEVSVFYDNMNPVNTGGLVANGVTLGSIYQQALNGRDLPWLTSYWMSYRARPSWGVIVPSTETRLLYLKAGQGVSQTFDVAPGQHFAVEGFMIGAQGTGPNGARIRFYDADNGQELTGMYSPGSSNAGKNYPASWGAVTSFGRVPAGVNRIKAVISAQATPLILGPMDFIGGSNLEIFKDIIETERMGSPTLSHDNDNAYDGGKAIREGDIVTLGIEVKNTGNGITMGDVTINDTIPEGFEYVPDSFKIMTENGRDVTASYGAGSFVIGNDGTVIFKPVYNKGKNGIYRARYLQGPFNTIGFADFDPGNGPDRKKTSSFKVTYKVKAKVTKDTVGVDANGQPTDMKTVFSQPSVSFINLWQGENERRTNYAPVVRMSMGTNTPPVIENTIKTLTIQNGDADAQAKLDSLAAAANTTTTDYEDDIRHHPTAKAIKTIVDGKGVAVADLATALEKAGTYTITYEATDADGNKSNLVTTTLTIIDTKAPAAPAVDTIDTAAKVVPITPPADADLKTIEVTFPGKNTPVVVTKNPDGTWSADGQPVPVVNGKLQLPIPTDVTLKEGTDTITAIAKDEAGNASQPGKASVTNQAPEVTVPGAATTQEKGQQVNILDGVTTTDTEDDTDAQDGKRTALKLNITAPDGSTTSYLKKGDGTVVKLVTQADGTVTEEPAQATDLSAFPLNKVGNYSIEATPIDSDGKAGAPKTYTLTVSDTTAPQAPVVDTIDTAAKVVPITPPADADLKTIEVTFPGKNTPVVVTKNPDGTWSADGQPVPVVNGKLQLPIPTDVTLKEGTDTITAIAKDEAGNASQPGKASVTNQAPEVTVPAAVAPKEKGETADILAGVTATDTEDDADKQDGKTTAIKFKITAPDGSTTSYLKKGDGTIVKLVTQADGTVTEEPAQATELTALRLNQAGDYSIEATPIDSDGKEGTAKTYTVTASDTTAPQAPAVDTIDTAAKVVPITPPTDADLKTIEVTFPGKNTPVVVTKNPDGTWSADGQPVPVVNGKLQLPIPTDVTLKEGTDTVTAIAKDEAGNASQPGKASVTNQAPEVTVPAATPKEKGQTADILAGVTATDTEDDTDAQDGKATAIKFKITAPDGSTTSYLKKGDGTVVKLVTQADGTVTEEPAQATELTALPLNQVGTYSIEATPIDSDGKEGTSKTYTFEVADKPDSPKIATVDTSATHVPITIGNKGNPTKLEVTFPGKDGNPIVVTLTKDPQTGTWKTADGVEIPVAADGSLSVPVPNHATMQEGKDQITAVASNGISSSDPGKGEITNQAPVVTTVDASEQVIGTTVDLTAQVKSVTDKEDDTDSNDAKVSSITAYKIRKPDGTEMTITPDEAKNFVPDQFGNYIVTVVATDSDGKVGEQVFNLPVIDRDPVFDKDKHHSATELLTVDQHTPITDADILAKVTLPDGSAGVPKVIGTIPTTDIPGNKGTVAVQIDYPDGTSEVVEVPIVVTPVPKTDKDSFKSGAGSLTIPKDTVLTDTDILNKVTIPTGSNGVPKVIGKLPDTGTSGDKGTVAVQIDYPDGTSEVVEVPVTVTDTPVKVDDKDAYQPATILLVVPQNGPISPDDLLAKVTIPTGSNGVATVIGTIPTTDQAGDRGTVTIQIDYPDGSSETVEVPVMVTPAPLADQDKYQPGAGSVTVSQHTPLTEADILAKVTIPTGSNASVKLLDAVPTTDRSGDKGKIRVQLTYPDGSTEIVEVPVMVTPVTPKDPILPTVTPLTVPQHTPITKDDVHKHVKLPAGAKIVSIGDIPSTETPGVKKAIQVVVELPDGRTVTVAVPVVVTPVDDPQPEPIPPQPNPNPQPDPGQPHQPGTSGTTTVVPGSTKTAKILPATGEERSIAAVLLGILLVTVAGLVAFMKKGVRKDEAE
ncbi:hypothetical protein BU202_05620 [Streptococcus cuniculi]|uniref:YSIRK-type signal peptide-containing protein n=1 Tax=Streptococcus cuniculi TaxID=1432788 RepID=A0A1Q8E803_9STRE|nr:Rib/alpha-like domain-containing protein [Streptococcus cuniculi]OLF47939.1 hypothetical protein BU202_05620 [Streptococcus cuniculi]